MLPRNRHFTTVSATFLLLLCLAELALAEGIDWKRDFTSGSEGKKLLQKYAKKYDPKEDEKHIYPKKNDYAPEVLFEKMRSKVMHIPLEDDSAIHGDQDCNPKFPKVTDLEFADENWQVFHGYANEKAYLLNAYYDNRPILQEPVVRIISYMNHANPRFQYWCRLWYKDGSDSWVNYTRVSSYDIMWSMSYYQVKEWEYVGFLVTCPLPDNGRIPFAVTLSLERCDRATNNLKVQYELPEDGRKKDFLVCVKHLDFPFDDQSIRLVEFLETNLLFGVDKVVLYGLSDHPQVEKVVDHYREKGKIDYVPFSLTAGAPNDPYLRHKYLQSLPFTAMIYEPIEYNDCYYRNMHKYHYILLLDVDEVFVPKFAQNYSDMISEMEQRTSPNVSTFYATNKIFVKNTQDHSSSPEVPQYMDYLQVTTFATDYPEPTIRNPKSFFSTANVLTLNNHLPYKCLNDSCSNEYLPDSVGQLHHYRQTCFFESQGKCVNDYKTRGDFSMWRFKDQLVDAVTQVVDELGLYTAPESSE